MAHSLLHPPTGGSSRLRRRLGGRCPAGVDDDQRADPSVPDREVAGQDQLLGQVGLVVVAVVAPTQDRVPVVLDQLDRLEGNPVPDHLLANPPADRILPPELPSRIVDKRVVGERGHDRILVERIDGGHVFGDDPAELDRRYAHGSSFGWCLAAAEPGGQPNHRVSRCGSVKLRPPKEAAGRCVSRGYLTPCSRAFSTNLSMWASRRSQCDRAAQAPRCSSFTASRRHMSCGTGWRPRSLRTSRSCALTCVATGPAGLRQAHLTMRRTRSRRWPATWWR